MGCMLIVQKSEIFSAAAVTKVSSKPYAHTYLDTSGFLVESDAS